MNRFTFVFRAMLSAFIMISASTETFPVEASVRGPLQADAKKAAPEFPTDLEIDKPVERELKGGERHAYLLAIKGGRYAEINVEQKGIDVTVGLLDGAGVKIVDKDSPTSGFGRETVYVTAETDGVYRIEVTPAEPTAVAGRYEITAAGMREIRESDHRRTTAQRDSGQAEALRKERKEASYRKAVELLEKTLSVWRELNDSAEIVNTLTNLGECRSALGETAKAFEIHTEALEISRRMKDRIREAACLSNVAGIHYARGEFQKAVESGLGALEIRREIGDRAGEAAALKDVGAFHTGLGEHRKALEYFERALSLIRASGSRREEAAALNGIGFAQAGLGDNRKALETYTQALALFRDLKNPAGEAETLNNIGVACDALGETARETEAFEQVLVLSRRLGNRRLEGRALNNLAYIQHNLGDLRKAEELYRQALDVSRATQDRVLESGALYNLGSILEGMGELEKALEYYRQVLELDRKTGDQSAEISTLLQIGAVCERLSKIRDALMHYHQALQLAEKLDNPEREAEVLRYLVSVYMTVGEWTKALDFSNRTLAFYRKAGMRPREATTLQIIGKIYLHLNDPKAQEYFDQSLTIHRAVGNRLGEAGVHGDRGIGYYNRKEYEKALVIFEQALDLFRKAGHRKNEATLLYSIGTCHAGLGNYHEAVKYYGESLEVFDSPYALWGLAATQYRLGNLAEARKNLEKAVGIVESTRSNIVDPNLRAGYFTAMERIYSSYVVVLMDSHKADPEAGHDRLAFEINERRRARALLELLAEARADIRQGVDAALLEREKHLRQRLNDKADIHFRLKFARNRERQTQLIEQDIALLTMEFDQVRDEIRRTSPRYAALTQPRPMTLKAVQELLDPDTMLLEYSLNIERPSYVFVVTKDGMTSHALSRGDEIQEAARRVYHLLTKRNAPESIGPNERKAEIAEADAEYERAAADLSRMILGPVADRLGTKRLAIVADESLQYVPFAALPIPRKTEGAQGRNRSSIPLIAEHEIVYLPSASTLGEQRKQLAGRKPAENLVAVLADPVFSETDSRVPHPDGLKSMTAKTPQTEGPTVADMSERDFGLEESMLKQAVKETELAAGDLRIPRLKFTREEADGIVKLVPSGASKRALDFMANLDTAKSPELSRYRIIHFATHGLLNASNPELSGLLLSLVDEHGKPRNGFLRVTDIFNLNLPADLVVLSACKTGLGKEVRGEGLMGMSRAFMYAGAERLMVSLWSVNDKATSELMIRFHRKILKEKQRPAAALREAQLEMMRDAKRKSPFYWAPFVLQGEWR